MNQQNLRRNLVELLRGGHAHASPKDALRGIDETKRNVRPSGAEHSVWELLEHMRLAQEDILRYTLDANWVSPEFPSGYWPAKADRLESADWDLSVAKFFADLEEAIKLVEDARVELTSEIPHGEGRTYLRQVLLIADHNAYHLGQIVQVRKLLEDWTA